MDRSLQRLVTVLILAFSFGIPALAWAECPVDDSTSSVRAKVTKVSDGDTIRVANGSTSFAVRFLSIDTPETHYEGQSQGVWAERAAQRLAQLLPVGTQVELQLDVEKCDGYD